MKANRVSLGIFAALAVAGSFMVSCKDDEVSLPPIGGFNNADEVATSNLVAYWGLNGDGKEAKSGAMPTKSQNVTFVSGGPKGQAANLASGFLAYDVIPALSSLPNMTVSMWVNVKNNEKSASAFFTLTRPNVWNGNINFMAETGWHKPTSDTLVIKGYVVTMVNGNESGQDVRNDPPKGGVQAGVYGGKWTHVVMTYDGATSMFKIYANGVKISNPEWEQRGTTGPLNFTTPTKAVIGAWGTNVSGTTEPWQVPMTGMVDEVRVYNKALSDGDISSLYQLELAGR